MRYGMVIDLKKCIGCYGCQIFCKAENATPPGMQWSRVLFYEAGNYPNPRKIPIPVLCMHCQEPSCVDVCPTGASVKRLDGIVTIDSNKCIGCLNCLLACPFGARHLNIKDNEYFPGQGLTPFEKVGYRKHTLGVVEKCNFCLPRLERGLEPACVSNCMTRARYFGDLDNPESEVSRLIRDKGASQFYPDIYPGSPPPKTMPEINTSVYYLTR